MTHVPVLLDAVLEGLALGLGSVAVDCTFGRGGHTRAMLARIGPAGRVVAIDRDPDAIRAGLLFRDPRLELVHARFDALGAICEERGLVSSVDGVLFDLGVSSPQLENPARGFSIRREGPLDMRMDPGDGEPVGAWLARVSERELAGVIARYGEERRARRIAAAIVRERPVATTAELAAVVERAAPSREASIHAATRTFQALRIHANREIECLEAALPAAVEVLKPGGRIAVISFHSLEDRVAKRFFRAESREVPGPRGLPSPRRPRMRVVAARVRPTSCEVAANPRSRSAVLRVAERVAE